MQVSKCQKSTDINVEEKGKILDMSKQNDLPVTKKTTSDLKIWKSSSQLAKINNNGQPSYADYENYFYI